jgi:hypothetical protein
VQRSDEDERLQGEPPGKSPAAGPQNVRPTGSMPPWPPRAPGVSPRSPAGARARHRRDGPRRPRTAARTPAAPAPEPPRDSAAGLRRRGRPQPGRSARVLPGPWAKLWSVPPRFPRRPAIGGRGAGSRHPGQATDRHR